MARSRSRYGTNVSPTARQQFSSLASLLSALNVRPVPRPVSFLSQVEDRRRFDPSGFFRRAQALSVLASSVRLKRRVPFNRRDVFKFAIPDHVAVCVRRKQRREVLHALKKTGAGARAERRRRNYLSEVSC